VIIVVVQTVIAEISSTLLYCSGNVMISWLNLGIWSK